MTREQIGLLIGGLGMFLFGTLIFEEAITFSLTRAFKNLLKTATNTLLKSIGTGFFVTAVLQSSGVVSLITLAFVGAGVIALPNALGIILGTNIGAPLTDILLGNLGLKFSLSSIAFPIIGIAGLFMLIFARYNKIKNICKAFVGLGLLFLGLGYMKDSMMILSANIDIVQYIGYGSLVYFGIGFLITILMQSSSATVVLVLAAAASGIIDYRMGAALVMGAFLGTTITAVLGAIGPFPLKKQVAFSHVFFNLFSVVLGLIFLPLIVILLKNNFDDVVLGLSVFAIGFKIVGVILLAPFVGYFNKFLQWLFPIKEGYLGLSIEQVEPNVSDAAIISMKKDVVKLLKKTFVYVLHIWSVNEKVLLKSSLDVNDILKQQKYFGNDELENEYNTIKRIEESLIAFGSQVKRHTIKFSELQEIEKLYSVVFTAVASAKYMKDISHNIYSLSETSSNWLYKQYDLFRSMIVGLYKIISGLIDEKYSDEMLSKMIDLVQNIKQADKTFLESLTKEISKHTVKNFDLSDILHVNRYVYLSSLSFVDSVKKMFLKESEMKIFEQLK